MSQNLIDLMYFLEDKCTHIEYTSSTIIRPANTTEVPGGFRSNRDHPGAALQVLEEPYRQGVGTSRGGVLGDESMVQALSASSAIDPRVFARLPVCLLK
jgi:hypothetical protein